MTNRYKNITLPQTSFAGGNLKFSYAKERIVPPDPISAKDKEETLERLDQIIEYRLVTSELPLHMRNLTIGKFSWMCGPP